MKVYEVGGCVRDSLLKIKSNDIDYVIEASSFEDMKNYIIKNSRNIFLERPDFGTIRYMSLDGVPEDISLSQGSIEHDLKQRDFTINAIARLKNTDKLIDPLGGAQDIDAKIIKCVAEPKIVFKADPARIIRAIRFKIQLGFEYDKAIIKYFKESDFIALKDLNRERLRQEIEKCLKISSKDTIVEFFNLGSEFLSVIFDTHKLSLNIK
jgi:tRNA nucleotidyltransferase/poly(A) polymerase